jgi:hypothetical protein
MAILAVSAAARDAEREPVTNGESIVREYSDDESPKTLRHLDAKGKTLATVYFAPHGIPVHLDFYNDVGHVSATVTFKDDGTPIARYHFDEHGVLVFVERFTYPPQPADSLTTLVRSILLGTGEPPPSSVRVTFLTSASHVSFTADGAWHMLAVQPKLPLATIGFQIKNPPDESTPDSTNIGVSLLDASSDEATKTAKAKLAELLGKRAVGKIKKTKYGEWDRWSYASKQDQSSSELRDAYRQLGRVFVAVRFTWPKLAKNPKNYDAAMEAVFLSLLDSVTQEP